MYGANLAACLRTEPVLASRSAAATACSCSSSSSHRAVQPANKWQLCSYYYYRPVPVALVDVLAPVAEAWHSSRRRSLVNNRAVETMINVALLDNIVASSFASRRR